MTDPNALDPLDICTNDELGRLLEQAIDNLSDSERLVITSNVSHGLKLQDVGKSLGVTSSRVSQLYLKAAVKCRKFLAKMGYKEFLSDPRLPLIPNKSKENPEGSVERNGSSVSIGRFRKPQEFKLISANILFIPFNLASLIDAKMRNEESLAISRLDLKGEYKKDKVMFKPRFCPPDIFALVSSTQLSIPTDLSDMIAKRKSLESQSVCSAGSASNQDSFGRRFALPDEFSISSSTPLLFPADLAAKIKLKRACADMKLTP